MILYSTLVGAKNIAPIDGEVYEFDFNIGEYYADDRFMVYDNNDVLQMIQNLTSGLRVDLHAWFDVE